MSTDDRVDLLPDGHVHVTFDGRGICDTPQGAYARLVTAASLVLEHVEQDEITGVPA